MAIENFYRLGMTGEKNLFEDCRDQYHGVVVGAHLAAFYRDWVPMFLKRLKKPFFIDPVTYVFARDLENIRKKEEFKKSYERLISIYTKRLQDIVKHRQLLPKDFLEGKWNDDLIKDLVKNTLRFQKELLMIKTPNQQSLIEYLEIIGEKEEKGVEGPSFLVAPYFYASALADEWYNISLQLAKTARKFKESYNLYVVICISKEMLLDNNAIEKIKNDYDGFDGYLLWISDFREEREAEQYLDGLVKLIHKLRGHGKPIYMLYGGYFSLLLSKWLTGYSRGLCYGESKDVDSPMVVGGPPKRYYLPFVHLKASEVIVRAFYSDNPSSLCGCNVCKEIWDEVKKRTAIKSAMGVSKFFDLLTFPKTRKHFIHVHASEIKRISELEFTNALEELRKELVQCQKLGVGTYGISCQHLDKWQEILSKFIELT